MTPDWEEVSLAPAHTDWLRHELVVSGPAEEVAAFRAAALGASAIPWHLDLDAEEARLLAPMATQGAEARGLARALRHAVGAHHERVLDQVRRASVCPLDLHRLVPVPDTVLRLGPDDPASDRWLQAHWGTLQALRHVRVLDTGEDRRRTRTARVVVEFHAADWSPWQALLRIRSGRPRLVLDLRPDYGRA